MDTHQLELLALKQLFYKFIKSKLGIAFYSQAMQDIFCLVMNGFNTHGTYLEIGSGPPSDSSNSFLLEKSYSYSGVSIEFDRSLYLVFSSKRLNKCINADATRIDYQTLLDDAGFSSRIDYLSLDIDPPSNTYRALELCLQSNRRFNVITFEHDAYAHGDLYVNLSRNLLESAGYVLVVADVKVFGRPFEDWWVDPNVVSREVWSPFLSQSIEFMDLPFYELPFSPSPS